MGFGLQNVRSGGLTIIYIIFGYEPSLDKILKNSKETRLCYICVCVHT